MRISKKRIFASFLLGVTLFQIWVTTPCLAATNCVQEFSLLGVIESEEDNPVVWIVEEISGECIWALVIKIQLLGDSSEVSIDWGYRSWKSILEDMGKPLENMVAEFTEQDSIWRLRNRFYNVHIPAADSSLLTEYTSFSFPAKDWNEKKGASAVIVPQIGERACTLMYFYPRGLYMDYVVDRIYQLKGEYLLVFTKQSIIGPGLDTMHGFSLLKWK